MSEDRKPASEKDPSSKDEAKHDELQDADLDKLVGGAINTTTATTTRMEAEDTDEFRPGGTIGNFISKVGK